MSVALSDNLKDLAKKEASGLRLRVYRRSTYRKGFVGLEPVVVISFVFAGIGAGVLGAIGKDLWSAIKKIARGAIQQGGSRRTTELELIASDESWERGPLIVVIGPVSIEELEDSLVEAEAIVRRFLVDQDSDLPESRDGFEIHTSNTTERVERLRKEGEILAVSNGCVSGECTTSE